MATGIVSVVFTERGYGFLSDDDGRRIFFPRQAVIPPLQLDRLEIGQRVRFVLETGPRGPRATRVRGIDVDPQDHAGAAR